MLAIEISSFGGPRVLRPIERPDPSPGPGEVLIRVSASGVARADVAQRQGQYPPPPGASDIPGLDVAGVIASVGAGVHQYQPGDRVCAILAGGGYAQFCVVPALQVLPAPENWSDLEAASLPENLFTVFDNLVTRGGLLRDEVVLIHGGTSGIGSMAIMLARALGAHPVSTAGSRSKCEACLSFGAELAINYRESDFVAETTAFTAAKGVQIVLDIVGGSYLDRNLDALALEGRLVIVSTQGGRSAELDIGKLMRKRARIFASTMRARTPEEKGAVAQRLRERIWPLLPAKGSIRPVIDATFPLHEAWRAHERMESGEHIGKIILSANA